MSRLVLWCSVFLIVAVITFEFLPEVEGVDVGKKRTGSSSKSSSSRYYKTKNILQV